MKTAHLCLTALIGLLAATASAQGVYRIVGPDGRVTFSDQPPPSANARPAGASTGGAAPAGAPLPFELRQVATRYPVVLYTGDNCAPCNSGRNLLNARGVPYTEKTVTSNEDAEALKRMAGEASLPFMTIGSQQLRGYSDTEWAQFLDAAGYPKQSALPVGYSRPAATPLVAVSRAVPGAPSTGVAAGPSAAAPAEIPVQPPVSNPAGIRF